MNRAEYMRELSWQLRKLPKDEYQKAMDYFDEYFNEAGPENEQQAIQDLGTPEDAAKDLFMDLAEQTVSETPKTVKHGLSAVWIGILGVCAAPIALPLALALIIIIAALGITALAVVLTLIIAAVSIAGSAILAIIGGIILLFSSFADGLCNIGLGLVFMGIGLLLCWGAVSLLRWLIRKFPVLLGRITKGGRRNEKKK